MGRSPCCDKTGLKKGPWTPDEDTKLINYIHLNGPGNWRTLPKNAALQRCGKSCRLRWTNYLRPDIRRGRFSFEEEETIIQLHSVLGNKWSAIAARLPGRTDNEIKNYWNTHIRKRLLRMGIDPVTHAPRLDFLNSPHFSNLSNLLCLQTLLNPDALRLAISLLSSSNNNININGEENPNHTLLHKLRENQLLSNSDHLLLQQNILNQQTPSSNIAPTSSAENSQSQSSQGDPNPILGNFSIDAFNSTTTQMLQDNYLSSNDQHQTSLPATSDPLNFWHGIPDLTSDNSSFQSISMNNSSNNSSQNYSLESVMPTPLSSPGPVMNPSSAAELIIGSTDEGQTSDEKENFCSNLMRFEIPEGFEFDDFM